MKQRYSIYEAKAQLSRIIRTVKQNKPVTITERGVDVVRVIPVQAGPLSLEQRVQDMTASGTVVLATSPIDRIKPIAKRTGAVKRFLEDRD